MSWIDKMTVLGIRSFGIQEEDRQLIEFEHPLTLIVGKNGAGKTTIIECLKFATTGDQPGNTRGGAFVHDPKLLGESDVRAQVGLKFCSIKNQTCTIKRSLQVSLRGDKIQQKTLDSVITKNVNGETVSITSKCSDINSEMVTSLGVSKAVLDNVIFCHQEDSNWPLSESKVVKTKFDELFASTRYIKALDKIKDTRKEIDKERVKEVAQLKHFEKNLEVFEEKEKCLKDETFRLQISQERAKEMSDSMLPTEKQLRDKKREYDEINSIRARLEQRQERKSDLEKDIANLMPQIQHVFEGTDEELEKVIANHKNEVRAKNKELEQGQKRVGPKEKAIEALGIRRSELAKDQGKLEQEVCNFNTRKSERVKLIRETSSKLQILSALGNNDISEDCAADFESKLGNLVENTEKLLNNQKKDFDKNSEEKTAQREEIMTEKTRVEGKLRGKKDLMKEKAMKINKKRRDLKEIPALSESDSDQLQELERELERSALELKNAEKSCNLQELKDREQKSNEDKANLESQVRAIDDKMLAMQKYQQRRTTINHHKEQKSTKAEHLKRLKRKAADPLKSIGILDAAEGIDSVGFPTAHKLNKWLNSRTQEQDSLESAISKRKEELAKSETKLEMTTKDYNGKSRRSKEIEDKLFESCSSENFEVELAQCREDIRELQNEKGVSDGVEYLYKEFWKKLTCSGDKSATPCPLCHRLFDQMSEIEELAQEIDEKLQMAPRKRLSQKSDLEKKERRYQTLLKLKPCQEELDKLSSDIPNMKREIGEYKTKISKLRQTIDDSDKELGNLKDRMSMAQSCLNNLSQIDGLVTEIKEIERKIRQEESHLPKSESLDKTVDELTEDKKELNDAVHKQAGLLAEIRDEMDLKRATMMSLQDTHRKLQSKKLNLVKNTEKRHQLNESIKDLNREMEVLQNECRDLKCKIPPLEGQLVKIDEEKEIMSSRCKAEIKKTECRLKDIVSFHREVSRSNGDIRKYLNSGNQEELENVLEQLEKIDSKKMVAEQELQAMRDELSRYEKDIATCHDRQRNLGDNEALRRLKREIDVVTTKLNDDKQKLSCVNIAQLQREMDELKKKYATLNEEKVKFSERSHQLKEKVRALEKELDKDHLKNAKDNHRDCKQKKVIYHLTMQDLDKYHNALDRAIMRYHAAKMFEINKIIKEIWTSTYRGHDIDYIEICSDEDTGSSKIARRNYNYRLVKCSRGQKIDMRGRCSAGQKVLASLVIRLALAETFCINCGILALDEPTTNLDRYHIDSLARSLSRIIESRQQQRNFQLIVITHDEDFVDLLGHKNRVDHFFKVEKKDDKSRIVKCKIESLSVES